MDSQRRPGRLTGSLASVAGGNLAGALQSAVTADQAVRLGVTRRQLQGSRWRQLYDGVYAPAHLIDGPQLRIAAAALVLPPGGAISGRWAAYQYGVDVLPPPGGPVEVTVPRTNTLTCRPGLFVRHALLPSSDVRSVSGVPVTTPVRTAFDLARLENPVEAVVGLDALLHAGLCREETLTPYIADHPRWRGVRRAGAALTDADAGAESPMETRLRLILVRGGLPRPLVNQPVYDAGGSFLARPDLRLEHVIVEFDGRIHLEHEVFVRDLARHNRLLQAGYLPLRYTGPVVYRQPGLIVAQVRAALGR